MIQASLAERASPRRAGYTLIELLTTVGVIAILISLLLPAVQSARESARRAACANKLRQMTLSVQGYDSTHNRLPCWTTGKLLPDGKLSYLSLHAQLLPHLELVNLANAVNLNTPCLFVGDLRAENRTAATQRVELFLCPSEPHARAREFAPNNYRANVGLGLEAVSRIAAGHYLVRFLYEGPFATHHETLAGYTDGTSNTVAFSEKPLGSGAGGIYSPFRDWNASRGATDPDQWVDQCRAADDGVNNLDAGATWLLAGGRFTTFFTIAPPNASIPDCGTGNNNGLGMFTARSYHPGGVNAALMDGSVRWYSESTDVNLWRSLGTKNLGD